MVSVQHARQSDQAFFDTEAMRRLARDRGLSQRALAKELGVDKGTVIRWAHAQVEPSPRLLLEMAAVLGVDPSALYQPGSAGRDLAYYRVLAGHSANSLASALQISNSLLRTIEAGRREPSPDLFDALRAVLRLDESSMRRAMSRCRPRAPRPRRQWRVDVVPAATAAVADAVADLEVDPPSRVFVL